MREYRIIRNDLGWIISRKKEMWKLMVLQYLSWKGVRTPNKWIAKTFYHKEKAVENLVVIKKKDGEKSD